MKIVLIALSLTALCYSFKFQTHSPGKPYQNKSQQIPGRVECEFYDEGGEGVAYHDTDSVNNGSGKLNPADGSYLHEFRMKEGVDISFTKIGDIDDNHYNKVKRDMGKLYVGWTAPGEWINYTVNVNETAKYTVGLMYTANGDGTISLDLDDKDLTSPLKVPSTHDDRDTVKWRQWHHWNKLSSMTDVSIKKGLHIITLHVVGNGNMNFDYMEFKKD